MAASSWLLKARTSPPEKEEAQGGAKGSYSVFHKTKARSPLLVNGERTVSWNILYKNSTNGPPEGLWRLATT